MAELGGTQKYLYWANRRVLQWLEDSDVEIPGSSQWKLATPDPGRILPTIELPGGQGRTTKTDLAEAFQKSFGKRIVSDLSSPVTVEFASGAGPLTFGEFVSPEGVPQRALIYISVPVDGGGHVAVCLFGSLENYADFVIEAGAQRGVGGWTAPSARDIMRFLSTGKYKNGVCCDSREDIAREAVKVCVGQGEAGSSLGYKKGYDRQFTYGETKGLSEWCAEIYLDVDLPRSELGGGGGHVRVLVGAPLWVRAPTLRNIFLYSDYTRNELEDLDRRSSIGAPSSSGERLKRAIRVFRGFEQ